MSGGPPRRGSPLTELAREERHATALAVTGVVRACDLRRRQRRNGPEFFLQSFQRPFSKTFGSDDLQGDASIFVRVVGQIYGTNTARTELAQDAIAAGDLQIARMGAAQGTHSFFLYRFTPWEGRCQP